MGARLHGQGETKAWKRRRYFSFQRGKYGTTMVYPRFDLKRHLPWLLVVAVGIVGAFFLFWR